MIGYKLFRTMKTKEGLYPLYVNADKVTPIGEWIEAECGQMTKNGKVKSKLGELKYRAGWHCTDLPYVTHIGEKDETGKIAYMRPDVVWAEIEISDNVSYQEEANKNGIGKNGKFNPRNADLRHIPKDGYYRYKTNPNMTGDWIICGAIKVLRVLDYSEVVDICHAHGLEPLPYK